MNKSQIFKFFDEKISKTCIQESDGIFMVIGKFCKVETYENGNLDIFVCNPTNMAKGLGTGKVRNIMKAINNPSWHEVNNEAWSIDATKADVIDNLRTLGIRQKRTMSDEQREMVTERFRIARLAQKTRVGTPL